MGARGALYELPTPTNISAIRNFGSLLGLCLIIQIITGLFLAIHYCGDVSLAFYSVNHISCKWRKIFFLSVYSYTWVEAFITVLMYLPRLEWLEEFFYICLFLHVGRGLYYGSYVFAQT